MRTKIVFHDGSWIIGKRVSFWDKLFLPETQGTHHWWVEETSWARENIDIQDMRVAIPISSMKYMVFL